jgi:hypothetical protein
MKARLTFLMLFLKAILFYSVTTFGQPKWERVQFDDRVHFLIPIDYEKSHDVGRNSFSAFSELGYLQVDKLPQPQAEIYNEEDLNNCYQLFQQSIIINSYGAFATDSTFKLGELYVRSFEFQNYRLDTTELHWHMIVLVDRYMYSFSYRTPMRHKFKTREERNSFFGSIGIDNKGFEDQLTISKADNPLTVLVGLILRYILIGALVVAVVLFFFKKYNQVRIIKNILSWALLVWGAVCVFIYLGNLFFSVQVLSLLIVGIVCLIVGFLLRILKLPRG